MVAFLRNEDELAGLLDMNWDTWRPAAGDGAIPRFSGSVGARTLSPDEDLFGSYNQFVESVRLRKRHSQPSGEEDRQQKIADQLACNPSRDPATRSAFPDLLDRIMQTKGKPETGLPICSELRTRIQEAS